MRTERFFLFVVLSVILSFPAIAQVGLPEEPVDPGLIDRPNPTLAGIEEVYVDLRQAGTEPNKDGLVWEDLRTKVRDKLVKAGIKMYSGDVRGWPTRQGTPVLTIDVEMLKLEDVQKHVFRIQAALSRPVRLARRGTRTFMAQVWKHGASMQAVDVVNMPQIVSGAVMEQSEIFLTAWTAANPPGARVGDSNAIGAENRRPPRERPPAAAAQEYVGSKNSRVFHRADCRWVKRISLKNLVSYGSRKEAIRAGKKACSTCKP